MMPSRTPQVLRVGDRVRWRGGFGTDAPRVAVVVGIEETARQHEKYGREVAVIDWHVVRADRALVTLSNGHWAYGCQLEPLEVEG